MKASATMGEVNPDSVRRLVLTVENEDDAELLRGLLALFRFPHQWTDAQRLALAVLCSRDRTVAAELIDAATDELTALDAGERYVTRSELWQAFKAVMKAWENRRGYNERRIPSNVWDAVERVMELVQKGQPRRVA